MLNSRMSGLVHKRHVRECQEVSLVSGSVSDPVE